MTTMNEALSDVIGMVAGMVLGAIFFGGLWLTVRRGLSSQRSALWFFSSLLTRTFIALAGFLVVSAGEWKRLISCLLGFVVARIVVTQATRVPPNLQTALLAAEEEPNAS